MLLMHAMKIIWQNLLLFFIVVTYDVSIINIKFVHWWNYIWTSLMLQHEWLEHNYIFLWPKKHIERIIYHIPISVHKLNKKICITSNHICLSRRSRRKYTFCYHYISYPHKYHKNFFLIYCSSTNICLL